MLRWGIDLTLVWVLGVVPVWLIGVVDMHSSRLIALRPVAPTSDGVVRVLQELFLEQGRPSAVMTDNGGQFVSARFRDALRLAGVRHLRIRPGHPWTNGKTERVFRTVKELQRFYAPVLVSLVHVQSFCADLLEFYNHCRIGASRLTSATPTGLGSPSLVVRPSSTASCSPTASRSDRRSLFDIATATNDRVVYLSFDALAEPTFGPDSGSRKPRPRLLDHYNRHEPLQHPVLVVLRPPLRVYLVGT